jgi:Uri superfamily endonuclease
MEPKDLRSVTNGKGVYQLFHKGELVYVGKAEGQLRSRLERHRAALQGRLNISVADMGFKALRVHKNWSAFATEDAMISHYKKHLKWNGKGFGSNDPGKKRDHTSEKPTTFNSLYPINPDLPCDFIDRTTYKALELLQLLRSNLPYTFRFQDDSDVIEELEQTEVRIGPHTPKTAAELVRLVASRLPGAWQATVLPGRLLLYRERATYVHGRILWPIE